MQARASCRILVKSSQVITLHTNTKQPPFSLDPRVFCVPRRMQNRHLLSLYMLNQRIHHMDSRRRSSRGLRRNSEISPRLPSGCLPCSKHLLWMCAQCNMHTRCNFTCGDPCTLSDVNCEEPHCCGSLDLCLHFPMLADDWNCKHSLPHTSKRCGVDYSTSTGRSERRLR